MRMLTVHMVLLMVLGGCSGATVVAVGFSLADTDNAPADSSTAVSIDSAEEMTTDSEPVPTDTDNFTSEAVFGLLGYGTVNAFSQDGTTGGGDALPSVVTSGEEMQNAIDTKGNEPLVIHVEGRLTHTIGRVLLSGVSDVSIIGTGVDAELDGFGISLSGASNIIIQNLTIHHVADMDQDAIRITNESQHVWVDHCLVYNDPAEPQSDPLYDSLLDISRGSDYITVSWCRFRDHVKALYIGHSDTNVQQDAGTLHTTWHHNVFSNISPSVMSVRFGIAHLFNNRFDSIPAVGGVTGVGISSRMNACVRLELNQFIDVSIPVQTDQSGTSLDSLGTVELIDNLVENAEQMDTTPTCSPTIPYEYTNALNAPSALEAILATNVGPQ